jgi:hypothetical protein
MILLTPKEQLKKRKEEVYTLYLSVDRAASKLSEKLNRIEDNFFTSETTKRMLRYERNEHSTIATALYDYHVMLDQQIKAIESVEKSNG